MTQEFNLPAFLTELSAGTATPGGGSVAALAGGLGAALAAMVARLTIGRKRYAAVSLRMEAIALQCDQLRAQLVELVAADAQAYDQVRLAYRLPRETGPQVEARTQVIQAALQGASRTPLETMALCVQVLKLAQEVAVTGNSNAICDAGVAGLMAHAGLRAAAYNVAVNLTELSDTAFIAQCQVAMATMEAEAGVLAGEIEKTVQEQLRAGG